MKPVDGPEATRDDTDTGGSTDDTHGSGDGNTELGSEDDGDGSSKLHRETSRWGVKGDFVTKRDNHVVTVCGETDDNHGTTKGQHPDRSRGAGAGRKSSLPDVVDGSERTNGIGDIVGTVGERLGATGHDLKERVEVLSIIRVLLGVRVHLKSSIGILAFTSLSCVDVDVGTVE